MIMQHDRLTRESVVQQLFSQVTTLIWSDTIPFLCVWLYASIIPWNGISINLNYTLYFNFVFLLKYYRGFRIKIKFFFLSLQ